MDYIYTGIDNFRIRYAEREDTELILWFIKELAIYEEELPQVTATAETLEESLFDRNGAEVLIGEYCGKPACFALFFHNFSTFQGRPGIHLVDLYVIPEMRGKGIGKTVLAYLAKLTEDRNCGRLEWWVHDWNESAAKLYRSLGAFKVDNLRIYRMCGDELETFAKATVPDWVDAQIIAVDGAIQGGCHE